MLSTKLSTNFVDNSGRVLPAARIAVHILDSLVVSKNDVFLVPGVTVIAIRPYCSSFVVIAKHLDKVQTLAAL